MNDLPSDISITLGYLEPDYPLNDNWTHLKSKYVNQDAVVAATQNAVAVQNDQ